MVQISFPKIALIADDDEDTRVIVGNAVTLMGCTTLVAKDGDEALALARETEPDVAILDVMMPGHSGREVCKILKSQNRGALLPILILTARDSIQDKVSALDEGADDYLTKPFHFQELQARVRALLRVRELNLQLHEKNEELLRVQEKLIQQERALVASQLAGTAAHQLGQPLAALLLNCGLLEKIDPGEHRFRKALESLKGDVKKMAALIEQLKSVDPQKRQGYYGDLQILNLEAKKGAQKGCQKEKG